MDIAIRRAEPREAPILTILAHESKRHWGYSDELMALWRDELTFTPEYIARQAAFVAEADGAVIGVYALVGAGDERELDHFWVHPDAHGRAVGRRLLEHAASTARAAGASSLKIVSDPGAEDFYLKMGARRVGEQASSPEGRRLPVMILDVGCRMAIGVRLVTIDRDGVPRGYDGEVSAVVAGVLHATVALYDEVGFEAPWVGYLALDGPTAVGACSFKSPPRDARVEIAYFTLPGFEGRGIATAMAAELVRIARTRGPSVSVAAQTVPERNASHRVLEKLGFRYVETLSHPEDGIVWEWRLDLDTGP